VLDRRLLRSGWLDRLRARGVRVHARSLFLQGLLLMPALRRPAWFDPWEALLARWTRWCDEHAVTPLQGALAFAGSVPGIERLVVGVDSVSQWDEISRAESAGGPVPPEDLFSEDVDLIEPSRWKLT
jgi:aryl-alcohol dehydrogenase-like predicted oxidoreductase